MIVQCRQTGSTILYEYQPGRSGAYAEAFLKLFAGYHHCDGYSAYNGVTNVTRIACLPHIRRKFIDALLLYNKGKKLAPAEEGVLFCNELFRLDREYKEEQSADLKEKRLNRTKPVLDAFWPWLDKQDPPNGCALFSSCSSFIVILFPITPSKTAIIYLLYLMSVSHTNGILYSDLFIHLELKPLILSNLKSYLNLFLSNNLLLNFHMQYTLIHLDQ